MNETVEHTAAQETLAVPYRITRDSVVRLRSALHRLAALVANAKRPTQVIGEAGLRVNQLAHDSVEEMVRHQIHVLEGLMDDGAQRLQVASQAGSLQSLLSEQVALLPETRSRVVKDVRVTLDILGNTRSRLSSTVREELTALRGLWAPAAAPEASNEAPVAEVEVEADTAATA